MQKSLIITIGRQFGSGGHEIGEKLAKKLGIKFYDKELIKLIAKQSGLCEKVLESYDEKPTNSLLYSIVMDIYPSVMYTGPTIDQQIYQANYDTIRKLADGEPCVIVGRCADYILRDHPELVSVFIHANSDFRAARIAEEYKLPDAKVRDLLVKTDKKRANYYNFQSEKQWGAASSYNLCIESSEVGIDGAVDLIMDYVNYKKKAKG
ncbi:MAG: cytidylate kinase-like family protein [Lachnospiraceae bacterium]|nr:cytidylate kinase-like family protein [Lachnospiraceae bacterium]